MVNVVERENTSTRGFFEDLYQRAVKQYIEVYCLVLALLSIVGIAVLY